MLRDIDYTTNYNLSMYGLQLYYVKGIDYNLNMLRISIRT
jgi:hypothetical protein